MSMTSLFSKNPEAEQLRTFIRNCLMIETDPEDDRNTKICVGCDEMLQSFNWFHHQGRSNDVFLKQLPEGTISPGELYCRLCLTLRSIMHAVFPTNQKTDNTLCEIIQECIGINLCFYKDYGAHICPLCRAQLERFATFKRISKQILLNVPSSSALLEKESNDKKLNGDSQSVPKKAKQDPERLLEVMSVEDENTQKRGRKRKRKRYSRQVTDAKQTKLEPQLTTNVGVAFAKTDRQRCLRLMRIADDERNFDVIKEVKGRAKVVMDGHKFCFGNMQSNGASVWKCEWKTLHNCKFQITITADGKFASFTKGMIHTHELEPVRLLECPLGKGAILMEDGREEPFWLITELPLGKEHDRQFIYKNYRYLLKNFFSLTDTSEWHCKAKKCRVRAEVRGIFKFVSFSGFTHNHPPLSTREVHDVLKSCKINVESEDVVTPFRESKSKQIQASFRANYQQTICKKLAIPGIYSQLAISDSGRNYEVFKIRDNLYKIRYGRYVYKLSLRLVGGATLWKCIWESIHNCTASVTVSANSQSAKLYGHDLHCHPPELAPIFDCELAEHSILNVTSESNELIQLLARECSYFESRSVIFRKHIYNLNQIVNHRESRWSCVRLGSNAQKCPASLIINGKMESFLHKGQHCDPPISENQLEHIILPGNMLDLSVNQDDIEQATSDSMFEEISDVMSSGNAQTLLKKQLFDYPQGRASIWNRLNNKNEQFHFLKDNIKQGDNAYFVFYQEHRYSFASIDEFGVSQWICSKLLRTNASDNTCLAHLTIEGVFQRITVKGKHNHEAASKPV